MVFVHVNMVKENRDPVHILAVSCSYDSEALRQGTHGLLYADLWL